MNETPIEAARPKRKRRTPNYMIIEELQNRIDNLRQDLEDRKRGAVAGMVITALIGFVGGVWLGGVL